MNLPDLSIHAQAGRIAELNLVSLEGGIYLLEAWMGGRAHPVLDSRGAALKLRSVEHARDVLQDLPALPFFLLHTSVHDEMCGMPSANNGLKVPISLHSAWS